MGWEGRWWGVVGRGEEIGEDSGRCDGRGKRGRWESLRDVEVVRREGMS